MANGGEWQRDSDESITRGDRWWIARYTVNGARCFVLWERAGTADVMRGKFLHAADAQRAADVFEGMGAANDGNGASDRDDGAALGLAPVELGELDAA